MQVPFFQYPVVHGCCT